MGGKRGTTFMFRRLAAPHALLTALHVTVARPPTACRALSAFAATTPASARPSARRHPTKIRKRAKQHQQRFTLNRRRLPKGVWRKEVSEFWEHRGLNEHEVAKMTKLGERHAAYARANRLRDRIQLYEEVLAEHGVAPEVVTDMMARKRGGFKELLLQWPEALEIRIELLTEHAPSIFWARDVITRHPNLLAVNDIALVSRTLRESAFIRDEIVPVLPEENLGDVLYLLVREDIERALRKRDVSDREREKQVRLKRQRARAAKRQKEGDAKHRQHLLERQEAQRARAAKRRGPPPPKGAASRDVPKRLKEWQAGKEAHMEELARRNAEWAKGVGVKRVV